MRNFSRSFSGIRDRSSATRNKGWEKDKRAAEWLTHGWVGRFVHNEWLVIIKHWVRSHKFEDVIGMQHYLMMFAEWTLSLNQIGRTSSHRKRMNGLIKMNSDVIFFPTRLRSIRTRPMPTLLQRGFITHPSRAPFHSIPYPHSTIEYDDEWENIKENVRSYSNFLPYCLYLEWIELLNWLSCSFHHLNWPIPSYFQLVHPRPIVVLPFLFIFQSSQISLLFHSLLPSFSHY